MTTVVILLLGFSAVLFTSAIETNPDGSNVSVIQTVLDIWNNNVHFSQTGGSPNGTQPAQNIQSLSIQATNQIQQSRL